MIDWTQAAVDALRTLGREATTERLMHEIRKATGNRELGDKHFLDLVGELYRHIDVQTANKALFYSGEKGWGLIEWKTHSASSPSETKGAKVKREASRPPGKG